MSPDPLVIHHTARCVVDAYLFGDVGNPEDYIPLALLLASSDEHTTVRLHLNTDGGSLDTADMLHTCVKRSAAKVVAHTYGLVASAGTVIAAGCASIVVSPGTKFLIHAPSAPLLEDLGSSVCSAWSKSNSVYLKSVYGSMLKDGEMQLLLSGGDVFLSYSQLIERFKGDL